MSEGPAPKLRWNDRSRRWKVRWWHVLVAFVLLALLNEIYVAHVLRHQPQFQPHEKTIGKPDAGNPHVRFERRPQETEPACHRA